MPYAHIVGWGMAVPERVLTNDDLARMVDTNDAWIRSRTGIAERRIAEPHETTAEFATEAARLALAQANIAPSAVDMVIVSTSTPDYLAFPSTASLVQDALGATRAGAFDLAAACTGFIYALTAGAQGIRAGDHQVVVVIGAELLSKIVDWEDRSTCVLFGDGAGAVVLQASDQPGGFKSAITRSDGSGADLLIVPGGGTRQPISAKTIADRSHFIHMNGREVFRFATRVMANATREAAAKAGLDTDDIDLIVPHQANKRIIESASRKLNLPEERFFLNIDRYGNTSAASIPIALCEAIEQERIRPNNNIVFVGFGAGLTWGATLFEWTLVPAEISTWDRLRQQLEFRTAALRSGVRRAVRSLEGRLWGRRLIVQRRKREAERDAAQDQTLAPRKDEDAR